ncbi:unnamed protein product [Polarella glacialis]|uniref:Methionine adenosyltransferase n=1 Tax=Polarella glacialis TaxID=89957 RepID=A0A813H1N0_POLGL|nr:unnamed protein product [Polarella glacialis]
MAADPAQKKAKTTRTFLFSSESVNEGHPDKICDQVSDAVLDACLREDPKSKVACETATKDNMVMVAGEITTQAKLDYDKIVRGVIAQIGFDSYVDDLSSVDSKGLCDKTCEVLVRINKQSPDIAGGVHVGKDDMDVGAGDQGIMFGYASDETSDCMPLTHSMATRLGKTLTDVRKSGECWWLRPDGKTQVTIEYLQHEDGSVEPKKIHTVVISTQHAEPSKAVRSKECASYTGPEMTAPTMAEMNKEIEEKYFEWENAMDLKKYQTMKSDQVSASLKDSNYLAKWFIPEFNSLISELNDKLADPGAQATEVSKENENAWRTPAQPVDPVQEAQATEESVLAVLSKENADCFRYLPAFIRAQLLLDRDPHGNVQVAKIETEKLLAATISAELDIRRAKGSYKGSFSPQFHAFGYEGRAGMPTIFDSAYCHALGATAAALLVNGCTGLIASVKNLLKPVKEWECGGVPVTSLCVIERRHGKDKPVIRKALVELDGSQSQPYAFYQKIRGDLRKNDMYRIPGPTQFDTQNCEFAKEIPMTLQLELGKDVALPKPNAPPKKMGGFLFIPQSRESRSELLQWRSQRQHRVPASLRAFNVNAASVTKGALTMCIQHDEEVMHKLFSNIHSPLLDVIAAPPATPFTNKKVGVVFCGRQAPGCHDLVCGLVDMLCSGSAGNKVLGFVGGSHGLFNKHAVEITPELCAAFRGSGGLEMLGRTVDRILALFRLAFVHFVSLIPILK